MDRHNCTIVIDTNQFCGDYMLSGLRWKHLIEYLNNTDASLQMPSIVWEELRRNYEKHVVRLLEDSRSALDKLNRHVGFKAPHFNFYGARFELSGRPEKLSVGDLVEPYLSYVKARLHLHSKDFLPWDNAWFDDMVRRAIDHMKPFGDDSDKGFKDTLLWKTLLSLQKRPGFTDGPVHAGDIH